MPKFMAQTYINVMRLGYVCVQEWMEGIHVASWEPSELEILPYTNPKIIRPTEFYYENSGQPLNY